MRLITHVRTAFVLLVLLVSIPSCAKLRCTDRLDQLTWYEYFGEEEDGPPPNVKTEQDKTLKRGDYVLTDGMYYRVTETSPILRNRCTGAVTGP